MKSKQVPACFWGEAVATVVYVLNRSPTKSLNGVTPYEAWYGKKPNVKHMKIFGCIGHVKKLGPGIQKLSDRSQRMVFIGYEEGTKGYRLLEHVSKTQHISRDVIFEEDQSWDWTSFSAENNQPDQFVVEFPVIVADPKIGADAAEQAPDSPGGQSSGSKPASNTIREFSRISWCPYTRSISSSTHSSVGNTTTGIVS